MLTLNQIVRRIKTIALNHKQIKNFYFGSVTDFLTDKTTRYASAFLQDQPGVIDPVGKTVTFSFKMYFLDLEHVSEGTGANTLDVQSDMLQVATDLVAEIDFHGFDDWLISVAPNFVLVREEFDGFVAGTAIDLTIQVPYNKDICAVPNQNSVSTYELLWSYFDEDPYSDIQNDTFLFNKTVPIGITQYAMEFSSNATGKFLAIREPISEPVKTAWNNTNFNNGTFPDSVFRAPVIIDGYRFYVSRIPVVLDSQNTTIIFNV